MVIVRCYIKKSLKKKPAHVMLTFRHVMLMKNPENGIISNSNCFDRVAFNERDFSKFLFLFVDNFD